MKVKYMKPSLMVIKIQHSGIVCTSDPTNNVPLWDGEVGVKDEKTSAVNLWDEEW